MAESTVGALNIKISADTTGAEQGQEKVSSGFAKMGKDAKAAGVQVAKWGAAAAAAVAAVGVAVVANSITTTRELKSQAQAAGLLAEELQKGAFAAQQFGVEQDQYADILKDVNDKVGDFLTTGAGGMVDFFEQIAPKVGITADAFRGLNSQEALGLYISSLQKANVSQAEMTFYMEAIASDSTKLVPLFEDNAKALKDMTAEAEAFGIGLSEIDVAKIDQAGAAFDKAQSAVGAVADRFTVQLSPVLTQITNDLLGAGQEAGFFANASGKAFNFVIKAAGHVANAIRGFEIIFKGVQLAGTLAFGAIVESGNQVQQFFANMTNAILAQVNVTIEGINSLGADLKKFEMTDVGGGFFEGMSDSFSGQADQIRNDISELLLAPLPSDQVEAYVASAREAAEAAVVAVAEVKDAGRVAEIEKETIDLEAIAQMRREAGENYLAYEQSVQQSRVSMAGDMFGKLATLVNSGSKRLFEIGKAAAIGDAIINAYQGISKTLASVPYPYNIPLAAAHGVAAFAQVKSIASTSYGQRTASGGFAGANADIAPQTQTQVASITLEGSDNATFSRGQVEGLIGQINDAVGDGFELRTA